MFQTLGARVNKFQELAFPLDEAELKTLKLSFLMCLMLEKTLRQTISEQVGVVPKTN